MRKVSEGRLEITAVGDISLGDHPVCAGIGIRSSLEKNGIGIFSDVADLLAGTDICIGNLETIASDKGFKRFSLSSYEMRGNPRHLKILKDLGFNVLGMANNHAMQHGREAFEDTFRRAKELGIGVIGIDSTESRSTIPVEIEHEGGAKSYCFAVSIRPEEWDPDPGSVPYSLRERREKLIDEVKELKESCTGFLICSIHWGLEFLEHPGPEQVELARALINNGVDVVLGHHPHVLQSIEYYGSGLIIYSLGNFCFDLWEERTRLTIIAKITLDLKGSPKFDFIPVKIKDNFTLHLASKEDKRRITSLLYSKINNPNSGWVRSDSEYLSSYNKARKKFRYSSYHHFSKNILNYPLWVVVQSVLRTVIRRITGS